MLIAKVWYAKSNDTKMITIPKDSDIKVGDYVKIIKLEDTDTLVKDIEKDIVPKAKVKMYI